MRDIIFRGKRLDNGEWVCGSLIHQTEYYGDPVNRYHILYDGEFDWDYYSAEIVAPETIGQYTGLKDKNGTKIFEGDIVRRNIINNVKAVEFYKGRFYPFIAFPEYNCWDEDECEIIGNIHDNPELLED